LLLRVAPPSPERMSILTLNAGSTSLKFALFDEQGWERSVAGDIDWAHGDRQQAQLTLRARDRAPIRARVSAPDDASAAMRAIDALSSASASLGQADAITAIGHRVVHGGAEYRASVLIDQAVKATIMRFSEMAPLHNPPALKAIAAVEAALPGKPQVAVFDTAFFAQLPPKAFMYPVPYEWYEKWGIRRFGFHGTSHAYGAGRAAELMKRDLAQLRLISCHLGGGCSATAVRGGVAIATTLGFSTLDGLMMGTRCGAIDPGILLYLKGKKMLTDEELSRALHHSAGLLGVSGVSANRAQIESAANQGHERARLALDMFTDRVRSTIGALAATLGGVDALIFMAGIGEGAASVRAAACEGLEFMGVELDRERNANVRPDADIATANSKVRVFVIHTEEELMVARETHRVVASP
jgi:acetate kinase